ncbi:MAG: hypothetical protein CMN30_14445 [Sandaracinus sp.]|nr:hypothetical protein [Sandaracinus sp.]
MSRALLLDAGNTVVFLDHGAVAETVGLRTEAVAAAEPVAKRRYEALLRSGGSHEDGWGLFMGELCREAGAEGPMGPLVDRLRAAHDRMNLWRRVPEDFRAALEEARAGGWRIGVVSNSEGKLDELFEAVGLHDAFEVVIDSALVGLRKPDPAIFHLALEALGAEAAESWYAGDLPAVDVVGARAAGMNAALIDPLGHYADYDEAPRFASVGALVRTLG